MSIGAARSHTTLSPEEVAALASRARTGSQEALGTLYEVYADQVWTSLYRKTGGDRDLADDASMETWAKVVERIGTYDPSRAVFAQFVHNVAATTLASILRREGVARVRREMQAHMLWHGSSDVAEDAGPEVLVERAAEAARLARLVNALPHRQREALLLTVFDGFTLSDAASLMEVTEGAVKQARLRAFETLRKRYGAIDRYFPAASRVEIVPASDATAGKGV